LLNKERERMIKLYAGAIILLATGMGSILAANIFITTQGGGKEFGQGEYFIKACDAWITMDFISGATGEAGAPAGFSPLTGVSIAGLDASQCAKTKFTVGVLDTHSNNVPLYRVDSQPLICTDSACDLSNSQFDFTLDIDAQGVISLQNPDLFHNLSFDNKSGIYRVAFTQPASLAKDIARITVQSSNA
jgi:hypothetical protein